MCLWMSSLHAGMNVVVYLGQCARAMAIACGAAGSGSCPLWLAFLWVAGQRHGAPPLIALQRGDRVC